MPTISPSKVLIPKGNFKIGQSVRFEKIRYFQKIIALRRLKKEIEKNIGIFEFLGPENHGIGQGFMILTQLLSEL